MHKEQRSILDITTLFNEMYDSRHFVYYGYPDQRPYHLKQYKSKLVELERYVECSMLISYKRCLDEQRAPELPLAIDYLIYTRTGYLINIVEKPLIIIKNNPGEKIS